MNHALRRNLVPVMLCVLWVALLGTLAATHAWILSPRTLTSVLQFATILSLAAMGMGLVVIAGGAGIDLSVGGTISLSAVLGMMGLGAGLPGYWLPMVCLGCGVMLGLFNGLLVTRLGILPLIVTLGTFYLFSGLALALTGGGAIAGVPDWAVGWGRARWGALPMPFITVVLPAFVLLSGLMALTSWGRWIVAMGDNERAARLAGLPVDRVRLMLYALSGALAGLGGFISLAWLGSARPNIGVNVELEALTAVLLGGVAITGGRGGLVGVVSAALLVVMLRTALLQIGINTVWQTGAIGALLVVALLVNRFSNSRG
ncbi:ABC transporter permease [Meridianimarinicoccus roseus]|jgi:ribose/xylose/arabinose/galactoside ABC-type transport system permease subunit|uniref:ABC transporter permease n=1 Tax=Meridianimarinicoccus roseus TaxID=2072018 RepID=A0A2V2LE23_9RHOB|nr:ABC transporter permease [Meridianimarinicoccus roseus]PWR02081.1 ABC transporter permease [Meridianimarinicoccus roseus]